MITPPLKNAQPGTGPPAASRNWWRALSVNARRVIVLAAGLAGLLTLTLVGCGHTGNSPTGRAGPPPGVSAAGSISTGFRFNHNNVGENTGGMITLYNNSNHTVKVTALEITWSSNNIEMSRNVINWSGALNPGQTITVPISGAPLSATGASVSWAGGP